LGPTQSLVHLVLGVNQLGSEDNHSHPSSRVKNEWSYASTLYTALIMQYLAKHRANFALYLYQGVKCHTDFITLQCLTHTMFPFIEISKNAIMILFT
jgi:predicted nucleotide-binding protein (sugar kinase/HSP70/actin superfamily)